MGCDINNLQLSGAVHDTITWGKTRKGITCCSFWVHCWSLETRGPSAMVKVNVYTPRLTEMCARDLTRGAQVRVSGALMNRSNGRLAPRVEVRASALEFGS